MTETWALTFDYGVPGSERTILTLAVDGQLRASRDLPRNASEEQIAAAMEALVEEGVPQGTLVLPAP